MISKEVVFLLGAGASRGYGYPTGFDLMDRLKSTNSVQLGQLDLAGADRSAVSALEQRLRDCGLNSVDSFLKKNPTFGSIAKLRIAQELLSSEFNAMRSGGNPETWVQYLFSRFMDGDSLDEFRRNRCTFITLNYDRSLEYELIKMLCNSYGVGWDDAAETVRAIKIIHLHGCIGALPNSNNPYGAATGPRELHQSAQGILTLGEPGSEREYEAAAQSLRSAQVILSLGFGYHKETIDKLGLRSGTLAVSGSCQGLTQSEVVHLSKQFGSRPFSELHRDGVTWNSRQREPGPTVDYLRANVQLLD